MVCRIAGVALILCGWCSSASLAEVPAADDVAVVAREIDGLLEQAWAEAGLAPVAPASDAEFLRRVTLDLTGVIPSVQEVRDFLADESPDKRRRLVARLLVKPAHATHRARLWRDALLPRTNDLQRANQAISFEAWLRERSAARVEMVDGKGRPVPADKVGFDAVVRELLTAAGQVGQINPVAFYTTLELKPEELAASTSRALLGVQIQCAQCHAHPFNHWKQEEFWGFAAFFAQLQRPPANQPFAFQVVETNTGDVHLPLTETVVAPRFLGADLSVDPAGGPRRQQLAHWLTSRENPYFARATVNRLWGQMFGRGIVHPVDDFGEHNLPSHPAVLDLLARDFAAHGFDLRRLFRVLAETRAYQLSSRVPPTGPLPPESFARMSHKSLTADQIYDCLLEATRRRETAQNFAYGNSAFQNFSQERQAFLAKFEAPAQGATEFQTGIPQALTLMNGAVLADATDVAKSDLLAALIAAPFFTDEERVETLFLSTLSRYPTAAERARCVAHVKSDGPSEHRDQALSDVLWSLLNSAEFILNH